MHNIYRNYMYISKTYHNIININFMSQLKFMNRNVTHIPTHIEDAREEQKSI